MIKAEPRSWADQTREYLPHKSSLKPKKGGLSGPPAWLELLFGVEVSPRRREDKAALDAFLDYIEILDFPTRHVCTMPAYALT